VENLKLFSLFKVTWKIGNLQSGRFETFKRLFELQIIFNFSIVQLLAQNKKTACLADS
jgi:hypothetical protein